MKTEEIIKIIEGSFLTEDDYFNNKILYFMAGRFPDLAISHCMDIIEQIREKTIEKNRNDLKYRSYNHNYQRNLRLETVEIREKIIEKNQRELKEGILAADLRADI